MAKMRIFKFWNANGDEHEREAISLKKAVRSVQGEYEKDNEISVEYISKKGKQMVHAVIIPFGRKIREAILQVKRREAEKAKNASR